MRIYYVYTQYHLFNCLNIRLHNSYDEYSLLIAVRPKDAKVMEYCKRAVDLGWFDELIVFDSEGRKNRNILCSLPGIINSLNISKQKINEIEFKEEVRALYTYGSSAEMYMIYDKAKKKSNGLSLISYEEGSGSYCWTADNRLGRLEKTLLLILQQIKMPKVFDELWLYQPECLGAMKVCDVNFMPQLNHTEFTNIYNSIFDFDLLPQISKFVLFGGPDRAVDDEIVSIFEKIIPQNGTIKLHPRAKHLGLYKNIKKFEYNDSPWELVCMNYNMNDSVLISYFSTTVFTPKSIYHEEPYLIFLFELEEFKEWKELNIKPVMKKYLKKFISTYSDQKKIYFPKNISELKKILNRLCI